MSIMKVNAGGRQGHGAGISPVFSDIVKFHDRQGMPGKYLRYSHGFAQHLSDYS
jgi:hypothetical protein